MHIEQDDLTARARIRDAALRHFADHGADATTIRAVAEEAGVTPGLVCHHFGSKRGLREACDAYVLGHLQVGSSETRDKRRLADPEHLATVYRSPPVVLRYLARALLDGSAAAATLFDDLVSLAEENLTNRQLREQESLTDPRAQAAVQVAMLLGTWVYRDHIVRALDAEPATPQTLLRVTAALANIMSSVLTTKPARNPERYVDEATHDLT